MIWWPNVYAAVALVGALVPAVVGSCAGRRRGKPGALSLAIMMWLFALWGLLYAAELGMGSAWAVKTLFEARTAVFLQIAPLWLVCVLQYTGRERWLTRSFVALLFAVPLATLVLLLTRTFEPGYGPWFWVAFAYAAVLIALGTALLAPMIVNSQRLYATQSAALLMGVVGPWAAYATHTLGFDSDTGFPPGLDPTVVAFAPAGMALAWAMYRHGLLDISPVAHDAVVEGMSDGTLVIDQRGRIVDLNPSAARILRCRPGEVVGQDFREVMKVRGKAAPLAGGRGGALLRRFEEEGQANEEVRLGKDADARHYDLTLSALHDARGRRTGALVVMHEVTEKKIAVERLDKMAHYDGLTGLANRTLFHERLSQEIARARRVSPGGSAFALMFLDLDRFKVVNDTLGHDVGDLLLQETARRLKASVREYDVVARLGGDEFTVILPGVAEVHNATYVAGRVIESIARPYLLDGHELLVSTSVGVCFYPGDGHDPATLVQNADAAMYRAKTSGKNRYEVFAEDVSRNPTRHSELEQAIEENRFVLYFQPGIRVSTSRTVGFEALIRWDHPEHGLVHPQAFLPLAEETGHIFSIERWVLREACRQMRSWLDRYPTEPPLTMSVNLSGRYFMHPNLTGVVARALEETDLPPENLVLEVKEEILHADPLSAAVTLGALKKLGIGLAVDNFGAGHSSLQHLKSFPLDILKIDRSFIGALHESEDDRRVVSAVISLAHALGLTVVAQGVESPRQLMVLKEMGCDIAQGHYFAEGLSHRATAAFLVADLYY